MGGIKSSPIDGLVWRLAIVLGHCLHVLGGIKPFAHLLNEFVLEVRYRWESGQKLPGMPSGSPDHSHCLLQQKLQMINCCIEKKQARESRNQDPLLESKTKPVNTEMDASSGLNSDSEDDEFLNVMKVTTMIKKCRTFKAQKIPSTKNYPYGVNLQKVVKADLENLSFCSMMIGCTFQFAKIPLL